MPNYIGAKMYGITIDGTLHQFTQPVSVTANYPYGSPNYANGVQYQLRTILADTDYEYITDVMTATLTQYTLVIHNTDKVINSVTYLLNDNFTLQTVPSLASNVATVLTPITIEYTFMPDYDDDNEAFYGGTYKNYIPNSLYGWKMIDANLSFSTVGTIEIDNTKYPINVPFTSPASLIEFKLNALNKGTYAVTKHSGDAEQVAYIQVNKVSRDNFFPQAMSMVWLSDDYKSTNGEVEKVRAFEVLDMLVGDIVNTPIYRTENDNCITAEEYNNVLKMAAVICPECCS